MHTHACMYIHACMHMHMLNMTPMKAAIYNFWTCIFVFFRITAGVCVHVHVCMWGQKPCPHIPPHLPVPSPEPGGAQITKNAINLEQIKIIQFHLKILDLCTFLQLYRLGSLCRWGLSHPKIAFLCFCTKKSTCFLFQLNIFHFTLESDRPCLDWQLIWYLTS